MSLKKQVSRLVLARSRPLHRVVATGIHPSHRGRRIAAVGRTIRFEVATEWLGRPTTVPIGDRSRIIAYRGETNPQHAVVRNPPNWPEMLVWKRYLRPGDLFIDVGANIGAYTIYALECGAEVIAVEPVARNADRVREHLALNGYSAQVLQKALADQPGVVHMTTDEDSYNHITDAAAPGEDVEATTLDALLNGRAASVKIDVEGAEDLVLAGARHALLEQRIRLLQLEWLVTGRMGIDDRTSVGTILAEADYELFRPDRYGHLSRIGDAGPNQSELNVFAMPREALKSVL